MDSEHPQQLQERDSVLQWRVRPQLLAHNQLRLPQQVADSALLRRLVPQQRVGRSVRSHQRLQQRAADLAPLPRLVPRQRVRRSARNQLRP